MEGAQVAVASRVVEDGAILIEKDVPIPLLDSHTVYCNVFRPNKPGTAPPLARTEWVRYSLDASDKSLRERHPRAPGTSAMRHNVKA